MTDWDDYAEAVAALVRIPALESERRRVIASEERAAVTAARADLDAELRRCEDWAADARRALTNAEAKLVAAHVLIPAQAADAVTGAPAELAAGLRDCDEEFRAALAGLASARRGAARDQAAADARAAASAARRRQLAKVAALAFAVLVLLISGYLAAR